MSLFGTKHNVVFSSVVYNMAGPEDKRPNYLKTTLLNAVLQSSSIPETLGNSYLHGPGIGLRTFANWAQSTGFYATVGQNNSHLVLAQSVDQTALAALIPHTSDQTVVVQTSLIGRANFLQWADQYVAVNYPDQIGTAYTAAIDNSSNTITVTFVDTTTVSFVASDYDPMGRYLYSVYNFTTGRITGSMVTGSTVFLTSGQSMPSTSGWTYDGNNVWERTVYQGRSGSSLMSQRQVMTQDPVARSYRIDTQQITDQSWSNVNVLIYKQGSGNTAMDALFQTTTSGGDFFPYIPMRLFQTFVSPSFVPDIYAAGKKALKKSVNGDFDKIISKISTNPSLANIENAYVVFGVSLNVKENACRKYIYQFFQQITAGQDLSGSSYLAWQSAWNAADTQAKAWQAWSAAQSDPNSPQYGAAEPVQPAYPVAPVTSVQINSAGRAGINYASTVEWAGIKETTGTGLLSVTAKPGDLWFTVVNSVDSATTLVTSLSSFTGAVESSVQNVRLNWQVDANHWKYLDIYGLTHIHLLQGKSFITTLAVDALADGNESGFIIPLHQGIFNTMPLVDATQMSTACAFLVFTCAQVVKTQWYQSGAFQVLVIIVIIIIAVVITIATEGAATPGLLGTAGQVGAAVGLTGVAAVVAGAVLNALAAMVLVQIITQGATAAFGPKTGAIIGAIVSFIAVSAGTAYMSGMSLAATYSSMTSVMNLLKLTLATIDGISGYIKASVQDTLKETQDIYTSYTKDAKQIEQQSMALFGSDNAVLDPVAYVDGGNQQTKISFDLEAINTFLTRTLLTGTDLAELSMDMIQNFSDLTLTTDLPI